MSDDSKAEAARVDFDDYPQRGEGGAFTDEERAKLLEWAEMTEFNAPAEEPMRSTWALRARAFRFAADAPAAKPATGPTAALIADLRDAASAEFAREWRGRLRPLLIRAADTLLGQNVAHRAADLSAAGAPVTSHPAEGATSGAPFIARLRALAAGWPWDIERGGKATIAVRSALTDAADALAASERRAAQSDAIAARVLAEDAVESAARAIYLVSNDDDWAGLAERDRAPFRRWARAVLATLRGDTP